VTPAFFADIAANPANRAILGRWQRLGLPDAWLVASYRRRWPWLTVREGEGGRDA